MKHLVVGSGLILALGICLGCEIGVEQPPAAASRQSKPEETEERTQLETVTRPRVARGRLQFVEGFPRGYAEASRQSKPMLLFFTAPWCEYCHQMAAEAFVHPQVVNLSDQFVCVLVNADTEPDVCRQFAVNGYPTVQFLSPRGVALNRLVGKQPARQLMMAMQAALQNVARRVITDDNAER
jgi:thioredoxin-related protein